jgi:hypothetical protein
MNRNLKKTFGTIHTQTHALVIYIIMILAFQWVRAPEQNVMQHMRATLDARRQSKVETK